MMWHQKCHMSLLTNAVAIMWRPDMSPTFPAKVSTELIWCHAVTEAVPTPCPCASTPNKPHKQLHWLRTYHPEALLVPVERTAGWRQD